MISLTLFSRFGFIIIPIATSISTWCGVLFYILAEPAVFAFVEDLLKKFGTMINVPIVLKGQNLLIFHSIVFAILMGISIKYVFEPIFYSNNGLFN